MKNISGGIRDFLSTIFAKVLGSVEIQIYEKNFEFSKKKSRDISNVSGGFFFGDIFDVVVIDGILRMFREKTCYTDSNILLQCSKIYRIFHFPNVSSGFKTLQFLTKFKNYSTESRTFC